MYVIIISASINKTMPLYVAEHKEMLSLLEKVIVKEY